MELEDAKPEDAKPEDTKPGASELEAAAHEPNWKLPSQKKAMVGMT